MKDMIIGTHIAVSWENCIPYTYGKYNGKLRNGKPCTIDVDWKTKAYDEDLNQVGTDQISCWYCSVNNICDIIKALEDN